MVEVIRYSAAHKGVWDAFVAGSKNGTFLLHRDYMEYHADRFEDHSLLFFRKERLVALLPANAAGQEVHSHGGLSYGGIVSDSHMKTAVMLEVFAAMAAYFRKLGFRKIIYKAIPHIYHQLPAEEDLYALFRFGAKLYRRDVNAVIAQPSSVPYATLRKRKLKQAALWQSQPSTDYRQFMQLAQELLQSKYGINPAHSAAEIELLASRFPQNIRLYMACAEEAVGAGIVIYETATVAHFQYIGTSAEGSASGALDVLVHHLLTAVYAHKKYVSFGVSTEQQGEYLNEGLVRNKESYGARAVAHDFYELEL